MATENQRGAGIRAPSKRSSSSSSEATDDEHFERQRGSAGEYKK
jgi:hypothetical protein